MWNYYTGACYGGPKQPVDQRGKIRTAEVGDLVITINFIVVTFHLLPSATQTNNLFRANDWTAKRSRRRLQAGHGVDVRTKDAEEILGRGSNFYHLTFNYLWIIRGSIVCPFGLQTPLVTIGCRHSVIGGPTCKYKWKWSSNKRGTIRMRMWFIYHKKDPPKTLINDSYDLLSLCRWPNARPVPKLYWGHYQTLIVLHPLMWQMRIEMDVPNLEFMQ